MPIIFAPSPYRQPQRRNPAPVNAAELHKKIEAQAEANRRNN